VNLNIGFKLPGLRANLVHRDAFERLKHFANTCRLRALANGQHVLMEVEGTEALHQTCPTPEFSVSEQE
jgi:hypothetical protein